ncbi:hypothetical protein [Paraburkholderia sp. MM6662-R1]|uniref:hypothetical protein n=1 Tax=Paraburkholderia sp. MM6662-R1 TaxID=2991066 RepID=UPI003D1C3207
MKNSVAALIVGIASVGISAKTLTLECGELQGVRYGVDGSGKVQQIADGFAGSHPTIVWEQGSPQATISVSDATGQPSSDKANVVNVGKDYITWLLQEPDGTEIWTYDVNDSVLLYSEHLPRWQMPGSGAAGTVFVTKCRAGIN